MSAAAAFLQRKPLAQARALLLAGVQPVGDEEVAVGDASGRIASCDVFAAHATPHYRASAMDGIAVRSADTWTATDAPVLLRVLEAASAPAAGDRCCVAVDTGSLLPEWADAVVRIEDTSLADDSGGRRCYRITSVVPPGRDVRRAGEDIEAQTLLLPAGARIRAWDVAAMLSTGTTCVRVRRRPRVAILATGGEVVDPQMHAQPGQVIDSSSRMIAALVEEWGGSAHRLGIAVDDEATLAGVIADAAARFDVVCVIAGSSAGRKDVTIPVLSSLGEVFVHGVDVAPGRPVALARIGRTRSDATAGTTTAAIAVPGYPVSAIVACEQLLEPLVAALLGTAGRPRPRMLARVVRKIPSRLGVEEFRRVCITRQADGSRIVAPLPSGAGSISTVSAAHGWLRIGPTTEGVDAGTEVEVELLVSPDDLDAALVLAGSPSASSVALERELRRTDLRARVWHLRLGLADALQAVERGEAHAAGVDAEQADAVTTPLRTTAAAGAAFAVLPGSAGEARLDALRTASPST